MEGIRRVLLADTGEEFRDGFAAAVENEPDIQIVGQTGDGAEPAAGRDRDGDGADEPGRIGSPGWTC